MNTETTEIKTRLEYLRGEIEAERISQAEIAELQGLAPHIPESDTLLREWAGIPEGATPSILEALKAVQEDYRELLRSGPTNDEAEEIDRMLQLVDSAIKQAEAAPDLLRALQAVLDSEDTTLGDGGSILGNDIRAMATAAIAKAKGNE